MHQPDIRKVALFIAVLSGFITPFDLSAVTIALPSIGSEFAMDAVTLSWVSTAYLLAAGVFLVPFGRIADIYGRKKVFVAGLLLFILASACMVLSVSSVMIILLRVLQGTGAALIFGTAVAILTEVSPVAERGRALGIYTTAVYLGLSLGPFLGGFLVQHFGWRSLFLVNVPIGLFTIGLILLYLKGEWADSRGETFDLGGAVQYGLALICIMYGFSLLPDTGGFLLLTAGTAILVWFVARELRVSHPLMDIGLWTKNRAFAFSNLAALINYSATFAVTFFLSLYLQYVRDIDPWYAGTILIIQPVMQAVLSPYAGRLSDRIPPGWIASVGMGLTAVGLVALAFLDNTTPVPVLMLILAVLGIGFGLFSSPNVNAIMSSVQKKYLGIASGTLGTMRLVGQMLSMGIATMILAIYIGRTQITSSQYGQLLSGMKSGFLIFSVLCLIGIAFSLVRCARTDESEACVR